jgi:hypothetical protein
MEETKASLEKERIKILTKGYSLNVLEPIPLINVLFVDTETTGLNKEDQPISIGMVLAEVETSTGLIKNRVAAYHGLREPSCEISSGAYSVHGISKASLAGKEFDFRELVTMFGAARLVVALMATSNSPTFGQSNSPRQDGQIINFLVCLVLASFLGNFSLAFWIF